MERRGKNIRNPHIRAQYELMKLLYTSFTEDYTLANVEPKLTYDPNTQGWREKRKADPVAYTRQGLFLGYLDLRRRRAGGRCRTGTGTSRPRVGLLATGFL